MQIHLHVGETGRLHGLPEDLPERGGAIRVDVSVGHDDDPIVVPFDRALELHLPVPLSRNGLARAVAQNPDPSNLWVLSA
ncbi:hypothetical protein GCM10023107_64880 [Actinoplanes octamycinicus]|nr:hypothetical protein Aoc01nite_15410 [Actinoplanes octamycinicus]